MNTDSIFGQFTKEEYDSLTSEDKRQIIQELGIATLGLIFGVQQLGHRTLGGHLVYHHIDKTDPESVRGQLIHWLRWITAYGEERKTEIGKPSWIQGFAIFHVNSQLFSNQDFEASKCDQT